MVMRILVAILLFALPAVARADILIDDFTMPGTTANNGSPDLSPPTREFIPSSGGTMFPGFVIHDGTGAGDNTVLRWDGDTASGNQNALTPFDITEGGSNAYLNLNVLGATNANIAITLYSNGLGGESFTNVAALTTGGFAMGLSVFESNGVILQSITAIELSILSNTDSNATAVIGGGSFMATPVPEPGSIGLLGVAALGGVWYLRRRRKAAA